MGEPGSKTKMFDAYGEMVLRGGGTALHLKTVSPALVVLLDTQQLEDAPLQGLRCLGVRHEGVVAGAGLADRLSGGARRRPLRSGEFAAIAEYERQTTTESEEKRGYTYYITMPLYIAM